ncbi:organ-specific protein P4 [Pyrus x bretschneideri]|uniref:organ-specific protein P4 n=1 Tax=Pyrus x bretschneideri TaxID=225117 RepID=UPI000510E183|nr:organ-specific protein P4 [Pyrus x bretschneideri]
MKSLCATLALFSILLFAKTIESRGGVGEYWKTVMNEQSMPQAIGGLLGDVPDSTPKKKADDCHENMKKPFVGTEEFEPRPNVSSYHDGESKAENSTKDTDSLPKSQAFHDKKPFVAKEEKQSSFDEDFEPRPNISVYNE